MPRLHRPAARRAALLAGFAGAAALVGATSAALPAPPATPAADDVAARPPVRVVADRPDTDALPAGLVARHPEAASGATPASPLGGLVPSLLLPVAAGWVYMEQDAHVAYWDAAEPLHEMWVYPAFGRTVHLQRNDGGTWVDVATYPTDDDLMYDVVEPAIPPLQVDGDVEYRLFSPGGTYDLELVSDPIRVNHQDRERWRSLRDAAFQTVAAYCPDADIHVDMPFDDVDLAGFAYYATGEIGLAPDLSGDLLQSVALHECAHTIQGRVFGDDLTAQSARLLEIYGPLPALDVGEVDAGMEQNADCMAEVMGARLPGYYTQDCSGARGDAARAVLEGRLP